MLFLKISVKKNLVSMSDKETISGKSFTLLMRGFLYKENWKPFSSAGRTNKYTQDIFKRWQNYQKIIDLLKIEDIVFSTYDAPKKYIDWAKNIGKLKLNDYNTSPQFITAYKGMKYIDSDFIVVSRTDIEYKDLFYNVLSHINWNDARDYVMFLNCEIIGKLNDCFMIIPSKYKYEIMEVMLKNPTKIEHIKSHVKIKYFTRECWKVRDENKFYTIQSS